jgi:hypothetical protein
MLKNFQNNGNRLSAEIIWQPTCAVSRPFTSFYCPNSGSGHFALHCTFFCQDYISPSSGEIKNIIESITKEYGEGVITTLGESKLKEQKTLSTGSLLLDHIKWQQRIVSQIKEILFVGNIIN